MRKILIVLSILSLSGCLSFNNEYFTIAVKFKLDEAKIDLKSVQFYNQEEIVLRRELKKEEVRFANGSIIMENGSLFNEITIRENTPCVLRSFTDDEMAVQFEEGENKLILFKLKTQSFVLKLGSANDIQYDGHTFKVERGGTCHLVYKLANKYNERLNKKVLDGLLVK